LEHSLADVRRVTTAVWPGLRSGSTPRKNGSSARVLTGPAAAGVIRAPVNNRVDNTLRGTPVANHCRRRTARSRAVLPPGACRGPNSRGGLSHTAVAPLPEV